MLLPTTYALDALRLALIKNASTASIAPQLTILIILSLFTLPLGLLAVRLGFNQARRTGSLAQY
jgi:ABC-2 type transport system permease protein